MGISEKKMQIVINNYFKQECSVNTSIREAFEKGFRIGVKKALSAQPDQKKGRWLNINESKKWECSECGRMMWFSPRLGVKPNDYRFCPNCGAKMDGGDPDAAD